MDNPAKRLAKELKLDKRYYNVWKENLAMAILDQHTEVEHQFYDSHMKVDLKTMAKNAAEQFLSTLIDAEKCENTEKPSAKKCKTLHIFESPEQARRKFYESRGTISGIYYHQFMTSETEEEYATFTHIGRLIEEKGVDLCTLFGRIKDRYMIAVGYKCSKCGKTKGFLE